MSFSDEELEVARRAAARWGLRDPSFDDIISELTPRYGAEYDGVPFVATKPPYPGADKGTRRTKAKLIRKGDITHVRRWRELKNLAMEFVDVPACPICGEPMYVTMKLGTCSQTCSATLRQGPRGGRPKGSRKRVTTEIQIQVYLDWLDGVPYRLIQEKHKVSRKMITRIVKESGGGERTPPKRLNQYVP